MAEYHDDCIHKPKENICKLFDMSCAMFHTRIFGRLPYGMGGAMVNRCPYYENIGGKKT